MAVLQKIRNKSWLLVTVIGVALLAFVFMDGASGLSAGCNKTEIKSIGNVLGDDISREDFDNAIKDRLMYIINFEGRQVTDEALVRDDVWDSYVKKLIMENEFDKLGIDVSDDEWIARVKSIDKLDVHPILTRLFSDSLGEYNGDLAWGQIQQISQLQEQDPNKIMWKYLENEMLFDIKNQKYNALIGQSMYVTNHEAEEYILSNTQYATFDYVAIPFSTIDDNSITLTDKEIRSYYSKYKTEYEQIASKDVDLVFFTPEPSEDDDANIKREITDALIDLERTDQYIDYRSSPYNNYYNYVYNTEYISDIKWDLIIKDELSRQMESLIAGYGSVKELEKAAGGSISELESQVLDDITSAFDNIKNQKNEARKGLSQQEWQDLFNAPDGEVIGPYLVKEGVYRIAKKVSSEYRPESVEVRHILMKEKASIDSLKMEIESGVEFAFIAQTLSEDYSTRDAGGNLGWISESTTLFTGFGDQSINFNDLCFTSEIGDLSIVKSDFGYHLIQVTQKSKLVNKVKIVYADREVIASEETRNSYVIQAAKFKQALDQGKGDLDELVLKYNGLKRSAKRVTSNDQNILNIDKSREIIQWLYTASVGDISDVAELRNTDDDIVVAYVTKKYDNGFIALEDVKEEIRALGIQDKKAASIAASIPENISLDEIAEISSTTVVTGIRTIFSDALIIEGVGLEPALVGSVFGGEIGKVSNPIIGENAVYVIKVVSIDDTQVADEDLLLQKSNIRKRSSYATQVSYDALKEAAQVKDERILVY